MLRSFIAVLIGFFIVVILSLAADTWLMLVIPGAFSDKGRVEAVPVLVLMLAYGLAFGVLGCCVSALVARRKPMKHALILGAVVLCFGLLGAWTFAETAPLWYHALTLLLIIPAAWVGGTIGTRYLSRHPKPTV